MIVELSAQALTLVVITRLYLQNEVLKQPVLQLFLAYHLKSTSQNGTGTSSSSPTLLSLCESLSLTSHTHGRRRRRSTEGRINALKCSVKKIELIILRALWSIDTVDQLSAIAEETYAMLSKPPVVPLGGSFDVSQRSVLSSFVYSLVISLRVLDIDESSGLFSNFHTYRDNTFELLKELENEELEKEDQSKSESLSISYHQFLKLNKSRSWAESRNSCSLGPNSHDEELFQSLRASLSTIEDSKAYSETRLASFSASYIGELVENQIHLLQRYGTTIPPGVRSNFMHMSSIHLSNGGVSHSLPKNDPSIHYLAYLEALYNRDYRGSFDSLHRYFDYMVSKGSRYFYHFALVSKASLHQSFGESEKALDTIEEAISVARENKDNATLTYILSWLFDCIKKDPTLYDTSFIDSTRNELQILDPFVRKSSSVSLSLSAISFRSKCENLMNSGACFAKYHEYLFKSKFLSIHDHVTTFIGDCHVASDMWDYVGIPHLAHLYTELGLLLSESNGSVSDMSEFKLREKRHLWMSKTSHADKRTLHINEGLSLSQSLQYRHLFQAIESSLECGQLSSASELLRALSETEGLDTDCLLERQRLLAILECSLGNYSSALALTDFQNNSSGEYNSSKTQLTCILKLNILKSKILIESGNPLGAYSQTLRQMRIAKDSTFSPFYIQSCCALLQILRKSDGVIDAYNIAFLMIPSVFVISNPSLKASFLYALASTAFQLSSMGPPLSGSTKGRYLHECLNFLSMSISGFKSSGDLSNLRKCFDLEKSIASKSFSPENHLDADLLIKFGTHSRKGLDFLKTRVIKTRSQGYLERNVYH